MYLNQYINRSFSELAKATTDFSSFLFHRLNVTSTGLQKLYENDVVKDNVKAILHSTYDILIYEILFCWVKHLPQIWL